MGLPTKMSVRKWQGVFIDAHGYAWPTPPYDFAQLEEAQKLIADGEEVPAQAREDGSDHRLVADATSLQTQFPCICIRIA